MTQAQLEEVKKMSEKDFFFKYGKLAVIHRRQYEWLVKQRNEIQLPDKVKEVLALFGGKIIY